MTKDRQDSDPSRGLTKPERSLLSEALRRGEETRDRMESALVDYGRWLLINVFDDDAAAALDGRRHNPVWQSLLSRAGGPTLRVSVKLMEVSVRIAAHDKRINDDAWRLLEPGRKELLLPLGGEGALRQAAKRVVAMKMSQRATRAFVKQTLAAEGRSNLTRPTPRRVYSHLLKVNERLAELGAKKRLEHMIGKSSPEERAVLRGEVERLAAWAKVTLGQLKPR